MSKKVEVVLNIAGFNALRKSAPVTALVDQVAAEKAKRLGRGYSSSVRQSSTRCVAKVTADTAEATSKTLKSNNMLR